MSIVLDGLVKKFGHETVVSGVSLEIADGELFVLLGPSGSGKSTVLRMIAGLTPTDSGRVVLHGRDVTAEPPQRRGVGFVFQNYALFRNMSVAENIEFGLRVRKVGAAERKTRRNELLGLVGLAGLAGRFPQQLSGGQQQRVALARALAFNPAVLLLDEPFGALDAPIRADLRRAVRRVQQELRITTIFVTHDQEEAFELGDRVGIMNSGRLLEAAPPHELYLHPKTEFAATFLGTANLLVGDATPQGVRIGPVEFPTAEGASSVSAPSAPGPRRVQVLFRPEDVAIKPTPEEVGWPLLGEGIVEQTRFSGSFERVSLRVPRLAGVRVISPPATFGGEGVLIEALRSQHQTRRYPLRVGDSAWVGVRRVHALTHPGLSLLLVFDGTEPGRAAVELGAEIARLAHARATLVTRRAEDERQPEESRALRQKIAGRLARIETRALDGELTDAATSDAGLSDHDLVVQGLSGRESLALAERLIAGSHGLLLVQSPCPVPSRVLVCVAVGEPGKEDILFTARIVRHLGASTTIMSVLQPDHTREVAALTERFLEAGVRSMALLGVSAKGLLRTGAVLDVIADEVMSGRHDLLVLGVPLASRPGEVALSGLVTNLLAERTGVPVLLVRSQQV